MTTLIQLHHLPGHDPYATNYLIDLDNAVIVDVEASRAIRQAEVGAARTMIERTQESSADSGYGSAEMLGWLVHEGHPLLNAIKAQLPKNMGMNVRGLRRHRFA